MAHRLVWKDAFSKAVTIYERGVKSADWHCNDNLLAVSLRVTKGGVTRVYEAREWLTLTECMATLVSVHRLVDFIDTGEK